MGSLSSADKTRPVALDDCAMAIPMLRNRQADKNYVCSLGSISALSGKEKNPWSEGYLTGCKIIYYESNSALDGRDDCL